MEEGEVQAATSMPSVRPTMSETSRPPATGPSMPLSEGSARRYLHPREIEVVGGGNDRRLGAERVLDPLALDAHGDVEGVEDGVEDVVVGRVPGVEEDRRAPLAHEADEEGGLLGDEMRGRRVGVCFLPRP